MSHNRTTASAVTIDRGLHDWQILQQDAQGQVGVTLGGRWWTLARRKNPEVRVRIVREGTYTAISRHQDWIVAATLVDPDVTGEEAGKSGTWSLTLDAIPRGGPYRLDTLIGSREDALEWRRSGDGIHFFGVGDVWLIAGQSNAEGTAQNPIDDPAEIGVHQYGSRGGWQMATHGSRHHPWLAFAKTLKKELGYPIGLVPTAVGGSPMARWDPGQNGDLYQVMARRIKEAGAGVKGVLWYQGESDVGPEDHPRYKARFIRFVTGLRQLAAQPHLPIITVQLNRRLGEENGPGWEAIREYQRQLSHDLEQVYIISIFESGLCDVIHNGALGNLLIAQRAADTALGGVYGRDMPFRHPECTRAFQVAANTIELHFRHVVERLDYIGVPTRDFPFAVRDPRGEVPVAAFTLPDRQTIRFECARALAGPATITGAPGACPPHLVPRDINGYRGMLAFTLPLEQPA